MVICTGYFAFGVKKDNALTAMQHLPESHPPTAAMKEKIAKLEATLKCPGKDGKAKPSVGRRMLLLQVRQDAVRRWPEGTRRFCGWMRCEGRRTLSRKVSDLGDSGC